MVEYSSTKLRDCLGFLKISYQVSNFSKKYIEFLKQWGEIKIYDFKRPLIKVRSNDLEIIGVVNSETFIVNFRNLSKGERLDKKISFERSLANFRHN